MSTAHANVGVQRTFSNFVRSELWFDDGNIVLVAGCAAFKVHRGQLQRHSEFFSGLLSLAEPQEHNLIDGCVWVELHDCPSDLYYFLRAIYDGLYFKAPYANDFPALAAVLRLSTKYVVEHLRQHCLARIDLDWPANLAAWDQREAAATDEFGRYVPRLICAHPILIVRLALELGIQTVLCSAMYDLSRYGPSKIKIGAPPPPLASHTLRPDMDVEAYSNQLITLPPDLLFRTLKGRECAQKFLAAFIEKELQSRAPSAECANRFDVENPSRACHESFYLIMLNVLRSVGGLSPGRDADPLFTLLQAVDMLSRTDFSDGEKQCGLKLCHPCKVDFATAVGKARDEVWALLPYWFGVHVAWGV